MDPLVGWTVVSWPRGRSVALTESPTHPGPQQICLNQLGQIKIYSGFDKFSLGHLLTLPIKHKLSMPVSCLVHFVMSTVF